jgi:hypothetical protein
MRLIPKVENTMSKEEIANQTLTIESGVPVPSTKGRKALFPALPIHRMESGDSVVIWGINRASHITSVANRTRKTAAKLGREVRIFTKHVTENGKHGVRFWIV